MKTPALLLRVEGDAATTETSAGIWADVGMGLFTEKWEAYWVAKSGFDQFKSGFDMQVAAAKKATPGLEELELYFGLHVVEASHSQVGVSFSSRSMFRRDVMGENKVAVEDGCRLFYSLNSEFVVTLMYACTSSLHRPPEKVLVLRSGRYSCRQLRSFVKKDFKRLNSYMRVTSMDTTPGWVDRWRIGWLRWTCQREVFEDKGTYRTPFLASFFGSGVSLTSQMVVQETGKAILSKALIVVLGVAGLLGYFGLDTANPICKQPTVNVGNIRH